MRDVINEINSWVNEGKSAALATVVRQEGSSLRKIGAKMVINENDQIVGSISGGCVESSVIEQAKKVMSSGNPALLSFTAITEADSFETGLSCGGSIDVIVESLDENSWRDLLPALSNSLMNDEYVSLVTVVSKVGQGKKMLVWGDGHRMGSLGSENLDKTVTISILEQSKFKQPTPKIIKNTDMFIDIFPPRPRLVIVGASHIAIPLVKMAKILGYKTIVIDPRKTFATHLRFPDVDEISNEWPNEALDRIKLDENTYLVALSHDEKIDNPAIAKALKSSAGYVGVLGAKKNIPKRLIALQEMNISNTDLLRLHAPVGLDLGADSPDEIALSILAELATIKIKL
jgi:xanthine dehydrogenase accessory factor